MTDHSTLYTTMSCCGGYVGEHFDWCPVGLEERAVARRDRDYEARLDAYSDAVGEGARRHEGSRW